VEQLFCLEFFCRQLITLALRSATLPYALRLADEGINLAGNDAGFVAGINTHQGYITNKVIAQGLKRPDDYKLLEALWD